MKNVKLLILLLFANVLFGQTKFNNKNLKLIQNTYYKSDQKNIVEFMKGKDLDGKMTFEDTSISRYQFVTPSLDEMTLLYTKPEEKLLLIRLEYHLDEKNFEEIENALKKEGFTFELAPQPFYSSYSCKIWKKNGTKELYQTYKNIYGKTAFVDFYLN